MRRQSVVQLHNILVGVAEKQFVFYFFSYKRSEHEQKYNFHIS